MDNDSNSNITASCLAANPLAQALSALVAGRWDNWDLSPFMLYLVDVCAPEALPFLADQFDVDGQRGFAMAAGEEQQRALIRQSIALHKYMGTPWAIREACGTIGFGLVLLQEGVTAPGAAPAPEDWAQFRILIEADMGRHITAEEARKLRLFVEAYKNERSHLVELGFYQSLADTLFRPDEETRDRIDLAVMTLELVPDPAELNPRGDGITVEITANVPCTLPALIYWGDGTNDKISISCSGTPGTGSISITSDPNNTAGDRVITTPVETAGGTVLGMLTIRQWFRWHNAYSYAYNRAYNKNSPELPYLRLDRPTVWLEDTADFFEQVDIESNTDWETE